MTVRQNSDHGQLSGDMWNFLHDIYGGGPELIIKQVVHQPTLASQAKTVAEPSQNARANKTENAQLTPSAEIVADSQKGEETQSSLEKKDEPAEKEKDSGKDSVKQAIEKTAS